MLVEIFVINCFIQYLLSSTIYDCRNDTVYLNINEIAYYETTNFPLFLNDTEMRACDLTFELINNAFSNTTKMFTSFVQANDPKAEYSFLTQNVQSFQIRDIFEVFYGAYKGIIIFEENNGDSCPLESITRKKPFKINNENEVLYLYSNYYKNKTRKNSCLWRFEAPQGYGFKIVIQTFEVSSMTKLEIKNSTDLLINERSVKINHPNYNNDIYLEIFLSKGDVNFIATNIEFQAYITIVKNEEEKQKINCTISHPSEGIMTWSNNNNKTYGYQDNAECSFNFIIPQYYVVLVAPYYINIEEGVDYISYTTETGIDFITYSTVNIVLEPYKNGTERNVSWKFVSDGSVNLPGFAITFQFVYCQCENRISECGSENVLMNSTHNDPYFCGNLRCNITIGPCESKLTAVLIEFGGDDIEHNDVFQITSNGLIILDIYRQEQSDFTVFLNSNNLNVFQIITFRSPIFQTLSFSIVSVEEPIFGPKIILSDKNASVLINNPINYFNTIEKTKEMIERNIPFVIYCLNPDAIGLYNNESLTATFNNCFNELTPYECEIMENSFVLYQIDSAISAVTLSGSGSANCVFPKNVFMASSLFTVTLAVSAVSNENGACVLTILLEDNYYISQLWTTSKKENIKIYVGIDQTQLLFEFNKKTMSKWKNIMLQSPAYTVIVPKTETLYFALKLYDTQIETYTAFTIAQYPYSSLVTTPWYGYKRDSVTDSAVITYQIKEYPVKFTVLDYIAVDGNVIYFDLGYTVININKTGDSIIFKNQTVVFTYIDMDNFESSIFIYIETLNI